MRMIVNGKNVNPSEFRACATEFYGLKTYECPISVLINKAESSVRTLKECKDVASFCDLFGSDIEKAEKLFALVV